MKTLIFSSTSDGARERKDFRGGNAYTRLLSI